METTPLCQLICGYVEEQESPQRKEGYQTLLHGASLVGEELAEVRRVWSIMSRRGKPCQTEFPPFGQRTVDGCAACCRI